MFIMEVTSASEQKMQFMTLLVSELQNQNPLEPMDNQQMSAQLAQFSQLEQLELMNSNTDEMNSSISEMNSTMKALNSSFQGSLLMAEYDYAKNLLGKEVSFYDQSMERELTGKVEKVVIDPSNGASILGVKVNPILGENGEPITPENTNVSLIDITGIRDSL